MPSSTFLATVTTMEVAMEFNLKKSATGQHLFNNVAELIGLRETGYFGLRYRDVRGYHTWLRLDKKILKQQMDKGGAKQLEFLVRLYPESEQELIQELTVRLFYLQARRDVLNGALRCEEGVAERLASYSLQATRGDRAGRRAPLEDGLLPEDGLEAPPKEKREASILEMWKNLHGISVEEAMRAYLRTVQDVDTYGVTFFDVKEGRVGVHATGICLYNRYTCPEVELYWLEVRKIYFSGQHCIVHALDPALPGILVEAPWWRINKRLVALCEAYQEMYAMRRDPAQVALMREHVLQEKPPTVEQQKKTKNAMSDIAEDMHNKLESLKSKSKSSSGKEKKERKEAVNSEASAKIKVVQRRTTI